MTKLENMEEDRIYSITEDSEELCDTAVFEGKLFNEQAFHVFNGSRNKR